MNAHATDRTVSAGILVTGTEVLTGRVTDRNGPWLAEELRRLGVDVGQVVVVGDRPADLRSALAVLAGRNDLVVTTGGLGPTADDLTAELVAQFQGRPMRLDDELRARIAAIVDGLMRRWSAHQDPEATEAAARKQAMVPEGASVLGPAGTAPGLVVPVADGRTGPPVVVLPGPPRELQALWPDAVADPAVAVVLGRARTLRQDTLRLWGVPESALAATLRRIGPLGGLEVTTCLRDGELEIVTRYAPEAAPEQERLVAAVRDDFGDALFSDDGSTVVDQVLAGLRRRGRTLAVGDASGTGDLGTKLLRGSGPDVVRAVLVVPGAEGSPRDAAQAIAGRAQEIAGGEVAIGLSPAGDDGAALHLITPEGTRTVDLGGPALIAQLRLVPGALHLLRRALA